jgi:hypothetical protein
MLAHELQLHALLLVVMNLPTLKLAPDLIGEIVKLGGEWYGSGLCPVAGFVCSGDEVSDCIFRGLMIR